MELGFALFWFSFLFEVKELIVVRSLALVMVSQLLFSFHSMIEGNREVRLAILPYYLTRFFSFQV